MRSTPLSPARGPRGALGGPASRSRFRQALASTEGRVRYRPALAPAPVPSGAEINREDQLPAARRFRDLLVGLGLERFRFVRRRCVTSAPGRQSGLPTLRPRGFNGLGFGLPQDEPLSVPLLIPPPRGISPSRRSGSEIPSSSLAFRPLPWKGQSPFRCLKDALRDRFGQRQNRPVIHLRPECQWTRVDNSTVRRRGSGIIPCRVAPAAGAAAR